jgi:hypothetical protein
MRTTMRTARAVLRLTLCTLADLSDRFAAVRASRAASRDGCEIAAAFLVGVVLGMVLILPRLLPA